jgi:hypothetical protein
VKGWAFLIPLLLLASTARAQQVQLQVDRGPYYIGTPIAVQVVAEGFDLNLQPQPSAEATQPRTGTLSFLGMTPSESSSYVIINGQAQASTSVKLIYRYQYVATQPGRVEIGPFRVQQAGTLRSTSTYALDVADVPRSDRLQVRVDAGTQKTYVGAQLRVLLEYRVDREIERNLVRSTLQVPAVDQREALRVEADPTATTGQVVELTTAAGPLPLRAQVREERAEGRSWLVVTLPFLMVPLKPGRYDIGSASFTIDEGVNFTRDLFGGRRALGSRKLRAVDQERILEVRPVPVEGRPASFAGAVGRGFALEVSADRSVVRAGDPIALRLVLRGDGPLASVAFPKLDVDGMLPARDFAVAADPPSGELREGAKVFSAVIRVKRAEVREIPELAYSFFDPVTERFETARSRPIALSVGAAEIVGPSQVVRSETPGNPPEPDAAPARPRERGFALDGADLSVVREPGALLATPGQGFGGWIAWLLYACGAGLIGAAWLDRRRRNADPQELARARARRELLARARVAAARDDRDALRELAQCVRALQGLHPERLAAGVDAFLLACDAELFAPPSADVGGSWTELRQRGLVLVEALAEEGA